MAAAGLLSIGDGLFQLLNAVVGRSWALDSLIALSLDNPLVKAGPIGACFLYAWYVRREPAAQSARQRILLVTLLSLFLIAPTTKFLSENRLSPRPFLLAEQSYVLEGETLVETPRIAFRTAQAGEMQRRVRDLHDGRLDANDLATFPSDHAAFFVALSLGILLASRRAGLIAFAWTLLVTLAGRVAVGLHSPLDVVAGALIGAAILALCQLAFARPLRRIADGAVAWTQHYPAATAALLFLLLLEAANTMQTLKRVVDVASAMMTRLL